MQTQSMYSEPIQQLDSIVLNLNSTSEELIFVMEEQIQAIISSSPQKIEELTEKQSEIQGVYKKHERAFLDELRKYISGEESDVTLTNLKNLFPGQKDQIERWKIELSQNTKMLKRKNEQLVDLLEFALTRNANLMHSLYSLFNNKNSHYSPNGQKADVRSGVAINQEV